MSFFPASLENLIDKFAALPGIGRKSAQRLAFHVLSLPEGKRRPLRTLFWRQSAACAAAPCARI